MTQTELLRVDKKFKEQLEEMKKKFEEELSFQISTTKFTKILAELSSFFESMPLIYPQIKIKKSKKKGIIIKPKTKK